MVRKLFENHNIVPRLEWLINKADSYGFPGPDWLEKKIQKLHVEMDQLRMRASDKCRKILTPVAPCGPEIRHWDKMIHLCKALLKFAIKPDQKWNRMNAYRVGYSRGVGNTEFLTIDEIFDSLHYCRIQVEKTRKKATPDRVEMLKNV